MELLLRINERGYPADYLLSRIKGRRARLINNWEQVVLAPDPGEYLSASHITYESGEGVQSRFLKELRWLYLQMNEGLRNIFFPIFLYFELRNLFICLRYRTGGEDRKIEKFLTLSLFSEKLKDILRSDKNVLSLIEYVEDVFSSLSDRFGGLRKIFIKDGLKGIERRIPDAYLEYAITSRLHPVIRNFFVHVIDARNSIAVYKHMRWRMSDPLTLIKGGNVREPMLRRIFESQEISRLASLIGPNIEQTTAADVESALLRGLARNLRKTGRADLAVGLILDYLWRCYIDATNLGIILYGKELERDVIAAELIQ